MKNLIIGQSGGPTAAINSSLAGAIYEALKSSEIDKVYGMEHGIAGMLRGDITDLTGYFSQKKNIERLKLTPSAFLGSCRYKLPNDYSDECYDKIFELCQKNDIAYFLYIGGNDSMDTIMKLSHVGKERNSDICFVGVPKTIDNDLPEIDHTPGYGSAAKFVATSVMETAHDASVYDVKSVTIIEIMGRNAGWLVGASALAKRANNGFAPHLIYFPEIPFSKDKFISDVKEQLKSVKNVIVAISEGIKDENGNLVCDVFGDDTVDCFGHKALSGSGKVLENIIKQELGCKVRSIEINTLQRSAAHLLSKTDIDEAFAIGQKAAELALGGQNGKMVSVRRLSSVPYAVELTAADIEKIANTENCVPREFINADGTGVTDLFMEYVTPLVQGEIYPNYENGVPKYISIRDLK